jgi:hypothetical protein
MIKSKIIYIVLIISLLAGATATLFAIPQHASNPTPVAGGSPVDAALRDGLGSPLPKYVYLLSCSGTYAKLDSGTNALSEGSIWNASSASVLGLQGMRGFSGCLINNAQYSSAANSIFAAVPAHTDPDNSTYWVVALKLPGFKVAGKAGPFVSLPTILLNADQTQISVEDDNGRLLFQASDLRPVANSKVLPPLGVSSVAKWESDGVIVDQNQVFSKQGGLVKRVDGYQLLTEPLKQKWQSLQREGTTGQRFIPVSFADSTDKKVLFIGGGDMKVNESSTQSGLLVYDLSTDKVLGTTVLPYRATGADPTHFDTPTVHLVPSQSWAIVEEYTWNRIDNSSQAPMQDANDYLRFKTGKIAVYDVNAGNVVRTFQLSPVPGFLSRVIGFSPEGRFMYYGSQDHVYIIDLTGERDVRSLAIKGFSPNQGFPPLALFLANQ